jgi:hypothetical protein
MKYPDSPIRFTKAQFAMFGFGEGSTRNFLPLYRNLMVRSPIQAIRRCAIGQNDFGNQ